MKKIIALLLTLVMVVCLIASCGGNADTATTTNGTPEGNGTTASTTGTTAAPIVPEDASLLVWLDFSFDNLNEDGDEPYFVDMSGHGNHGYLGGDMDVTESANEELGDALGIISVGDYLTIKNNDAFNFGVEDEYTIDFWFKADTDKLFSDNNWPCLFTKGSPNATSYFGSWINGTKVYYGTGTYDIENGVNVTGNKNAVVSSTVDDKWHHYVAVQKDGFIYTYIDGVAGATELAKDVSNTWDLYVGGKVGVNEDGTDAIQQFFGAIDEFKIYNRALSASEITGIYPVVPDESKLVVNLDFASAAEGVIADLSGKGNNAAITGNAQIVDGAIVFDAEGEYLTIKNSADINFTSTDSFIIEFKYRIDDASNAGSWPCILSKGDKGIGWYGVWMNGGIKWGGDTGNYVTTPSMATDEWHTLTIVRDASKSDIYAFVDGVLCTHIANKTLSFESTLDLFIGGNTYAGKGDAATTKVQQFYGAIDDFKVYKYGTDALTYENN